MIHWLHLTLLPLQFPSELKKNIQQVFQNCSTEEVSYQWMEQVTSDDFQKNWTPDHHQISCLHCPIPTDPQIRSLKWQQPEHLCDSLKTSSNKRFHTTVFFQGEAQTRTWTFNLRPFENFQFFVKEKRSFGKKLESDNLTFKPSWSPSKNTWTAERVKSQLPGFFGQKLRQTLTPQTPLTKKSLLISKALKKGQRIPLVWKQGSLQLRTTGQALSAAQIGDQVDCEVKIQKRTLILSGVLTNEPFLQVKVL